MSAGASAADVTNLHYTFHSMCAFAARGLVYSQLPNLSGQAWASIGKSSSCMGHSADIVSLKEEVMHPKSESR